MADFGSVEVPITDANIATHTSTKITITDKTHLPPTAAYTDVTQTWSAQQTFRNNLVRWFNPGLTFSYTIGTSALTGNVTITLPLLTANDEYLFKNHPATLTGKAMSGSSNTFTNIPDSALSSNIPLLNAANTFLNAQKISTSASTLLTFHRQVNSLGFGAGFTYNLNDSASAEATYGISYVGIEDNAAGAVRGDFYVQLAIANALGIRFRVGTGGDGGILFGNNLRVVLVETGLTAQQIYTFPNVSGELAVASAPQIFSSKTVDSIDNVLKNIGPFYFEIFRIGSTYYSHDTVLGTIASSTNPSTILQGAINTVFTAGGGTILLKKATYGTTAAPVIAELKQNVHLEGEGVNATTVIGRIATTGGTSVGFCSLKKIYVHTINVAAGSPTIHLKNAKFIDISECKLETNSTTDPILKIDDDDGSTGKYSSGIYIHNNNYFRGPTTAIHIGGDVNAIHIDDCVFHQSSGARSVVPTNCAIFIDHITSPASFEFFITMSKLYCELYYAAIITERGWIHADKIWADNCEYGIMMDPNTIANTAVNVEIENANTCAFLAKIGTVDYAPGATNNKFIFNTTKSFGNKGSGKSTLTGNASTTVFNIPHGLYTTPTQYKAEPLAPRGMGSRTVTVSSTNITLTYDFAPSTGNFDVYWEAAIVV